jgi:hypothetical protein
MITNIKLFNILLFLLLISSMNQLFAQDLKLIKYKPAEGLKFTEKNGNYNMVLRGYLQSTLETRKYEADEEFYNRFRARRLRLRIIGEAPKLKLSYRFQTDFAQSAEGDDEISGALLDAFVSYHLNKDWKITFGQRATPTDNRELMMGSHTLQLVERSRLTSAFASIREFGIFIDGKKKIGNQFYVKSMFTITDGDGSNNLGENYGGLKYGGRVNFLPFGLMTAFGEFRQSDMIREFQPKLSVGIFYSYNDGMSSRRGRASGSILYLNDANEESLPDYTKYGIDFLFKYKGFSALGEYLNATATIPTDITKRVRNDGSVSTTFTGGVDAYTRGRMMLGSGINIQAGYLFKHNFSIDARYTHLSPDTNSFLNNTLFYNRNNHYEIGVSKYMDKHYGMKFQASLTYVDAEAASRKVNGDVFIGNEWVGRFLVQVAF